MTDEQIVEVVQAHMEGEQIECKRKGDGFLWLGRDCLFPMWNFDEFEYRVKPEPRKPREWYVISNASNGPWQAVRYNTGLSQPDECWVRVREVIE